MADVITRFKLETSQYDSKLRDTVKNLKEVVHMNELAGKDFREFSDAAIQAARGLGQTATGATNAKDKVKELVAAYNDMAKTYNEMSEAMKNSEGGKALAASLQELQGRIREAKAEMNATPGVLDKLASKFVVNIDAIKLFNLGLKAADAALGVAKDAFFNNEAQLDDWGRVMDSSKSLYEGFLNAINTGDISGYLSRIDDIVKAARTAYDELDRLGTMKRIQAPQISAQQTENERMRMMIQTGRYIAPMDGRANAVYNGKVMQNGDLLSAAQIRAIERQLQGGMNKAVGLVGNEVKQTSKAINALFDRQAKELGMSKKEFMSGTSSMAEFDKRIAGYQQYQNWRAQHTTIDQQSGREIVSRGNPYEAYKAWGVFRVDGDRYNELVQLLTQRDQQTSQAYGMQSQAYRAINRAEGITTRNLLGGGGGGGTAGGGNVTKEVQYAADSIAAQQALVSALSKQWSEAGADVRNDYLVQLIAAEEVLKRMKDEATMFRENSEGRLLERGPIQTTGLGMVTGSYKNYQVEGISQQALTHLNNPKKDEKNRERKEDRYNEKMLGEMSKMMGGVSGIFGGIEQMGIEIPGELKGVLNGINGLMTMVQSVVTVLEAIETLQTFDLFKFARGGIVPHAAMGMRVPGNDHTDNTPVLVSSGELILNSAQQNSVANALQGGGLRNLRLRTEISGRNLVVVIENDLAARGKGQLATFK